MAAYRVFFPIVRTPKAQLTGDGGSRFVVKEKRQAPKWDKPIPTYKTQAEVTSAIANGSLKSNTLQAYDTAKAYEKYLKELAQWEKGFQVKKAAPRPNGGCNFTFQFGK